MSNSRLVYSTGSGDHRRDPTHEAGPAPAADGPRDGTVRVSRETGGRRGKTVTVVRGLAPGELETVAGDLKRRCSCGGAVKGAAVELQGDHRDRVVALLQAQGYRVKPAGG